jgi:hypothetical protein
MARGYLVVRAGAVSVAYVAQQGRVSEFKASDKWLARMFSGAPTEPGVYRVQFWLPDARSSYRIGSVKLVDAAKEAARLRKVAAKPRENARTGSPGIMGYQERENASRAAQEARWNETKLLIELLDKLSEGKAA